MLFLHVGRNTELDGRKIPNGDNIYVEDDRELDKLVLGKFKRVDNATGARVLTVNDLDAAPKKKAAAAAPAATPAPTPESEAEDTAAEKPAVNPEWSDVTDDFDGAKKADLCIILYKDGGYQVFDADDKDNPDATPLNSMALKTKKAVDQFLSKYKK